MLVFVPHKTVRWVRWSASSMKTGPSSCAHFLCTCMHIRRLITHFNNVIPYNLLNIPAHSFSTAWVLINTYLYAGMWYDWWPFYVFLKRPYEKDTHINKEVKPGHEGSQCNNWGSFAPCYWLELSKYKKQRTTKRKKKAQDWGSAGTGLCHYCVISFSHTLKSLGQTIASLKWMGTLGACRHAGTLLQHALTTTCQSRLS